MESNQCYRSYTNRNSNKYIYIFICIKVTLATHIESILIDCEIDDILHTHRVQYKHINTIYRCESMRNRETKKIVHASIKC